MQLTDSEKEEIKRLLDAGEPLPDKYRFSLFREPRETELIWPGKTREVTNTVLPFQSIEQIDEPRSETVSQDDLFQLDRTTGRQSGGWSNKLIWGDNKLVLSSLKGGPLRREIEKAGGLKLVYIDPPFDVGADFSFEVEVGGNSLTKESSAIEEIAYRDTWGRGADSYIAMLYERLAIIHSLMADDAYIFCHIDSRLNAFVRLAMDEIFDEKNRLNHLIWSYRRWPSISRNFQTMHDDILLYCKNAASTTRIFNVNYEAPSESYVKRFGGKTQVLDEETRTRKITVDEPTKGMPIRDVWEISMVAGFKAERTGYPTQKPEDLLRRIIETCSAPGQLIADFFCGSGTTLSVAEKLGRKWIGADLGRFAIHTSRKRLIGVQRELKADDKPYRSFEILNLGKYERQYFAGIDPTLPEEQRKIISAQKEEHYISLILSAYKSEHVFQTAPFHGRKGNAFVVVGPLDAPVTRSQIEEAVEAARKLKTTQVHVLGFEFEMGVAPKSVDDAKAKGVNLALRYIPKEVFDKRAVDKNQVVFYDVAYVEVQPQLKGKSITVKLKDFGVSYRQDDIEALAGEMKPGTKVTVADGQVVKITKDKAGVVKREVLTKKWTDWIDYWAVDFDYASRPETLIATITQPDGSMAHVPQWTGGFIFENEWQSFRTRKDRNLELESAAHEYAKKGRYKIAVKVIDIFGNDTTKIVEVNV